MHVPVSQLLIAVILSAFIGLSASLSTTLTSTTERRSLESGLRAVTHSTSNVVMKALEEIRHVEDGNITVKLDLPKAIAKHEYILEISNTQVKAYTSNPSLEATLPLDISDVTLTGLASSSGQLYIKVTKSSGTITITLLEM